MTLKSKVQELIDKALEEHTSIFIIDFTVSADNKITLTIDGDEGVTLQDCINFSRAIEHNLDREEQDFSLEVASAGATAPLKLLRQYHKNIGRKLKVVTLDQEKYEATLDNVIDNQIVLKWKAREPKAVGKGKVTVEKEAVIPFENIKEANVIISF
ncbi:ribosome assembly cofactor RimP [Myroides odoratimimus]|uniref:ribosome assembly cofactor RimP n=1 Tax=Myroides odoratimimus TaxID=76832 RepID=UPI002575E46B|nr:ribosome assembly cofactor RimP [Myroides odoratimimus]MDM1396665.1 ribosome assembly cofactor RimP [Myroides odoratimimus]